MINAPTSVLFVCLGNICRSPSAEAVMRAKAHEQGLSIHFDSAGTANYHSGSPPDERAIQTGRNLGFDLTSLQARQVRRQDFYDFGIIFAMDKQNFANLQALAPTDATAQVLMFDDVPVADPYYGDMADFEAMFLHIQTASERWLTLWQNS